MTKISGHWLLAATFVIAVAGLVYELIAATVSSYLLGDSVTQFSLVIGVFLSAMGLGAWLSRYVHDAPLGFVAAQILLGVVGAVSAPLLFVSYAYLDHVQFLLFSSLLVTGALVGMEIPLITRILQAQSADEHVLSNVLTADYIGALAASVCFPLFIIPQLGLMSAGVVFGLLNLAVALLSLWIFRHQVLRSLWWGWGAAFALCVALLVHVEDVVSVVDAALYDDEIIFKEQTPHQLVTLTRYRDRYRLYLNNAIQFDSRDEYRYHEPLVHPAMSLSSRRASVLILGGGDGLAAREVLRYNEVKQLTLVDLDPRVTTLFSQHEALLALNDGALTDPRVSIVNQDAWQFIKESNTGYDVVILDLPDPHSLGISKLYSREFYEMLSDKLNKGGAMVTQAGSPLFAREAFWSIHDTLANTNSGLGLGKTLHTLPYHAYVPSFGEWGFVLVSAFDLSQKSLQLSHSLKFLTAEAWPSMRHFTPDIAPLSVPQNSIQTHALVQLYQKGWTHWFE